LKGIIVEKKEEIALINDQGKTMTFEQAHEAIRETIRRHGRFILSNPDPQQIGEVRDYAGLPMRVVRLVPTEEAFVERCPDIWGEVWNGDDEFYFEVEVAD
jgi:hypothetical protein